MRYVFSFGFALALGLALMAGCSDEDGEGGSGGTAGTGGSGGSDLCAGITCEDTECKMDGACNPSDGMCDYALVEDGTSCSEGECLDGVCAPIGAFPCTEQGIRDAIAEGGGPHFFACDGPTTVATEAMIEINNDVILDGGFDLSVEGPGLSVFEGMVELRKLTVSGGSGNIYNRGTLTISQVSVLDNVCGGSCTRGAVENDGTLTVVKCAISGNEPGIGGAIHNGADGDVTVTNTTVSGNGGLAAIANAGTMTVLSSTVSQDPAVMVSQSGTLTMKNTIVDGSCEATDAGTVTSNGHNIESPGNTCGFDQDTDQAEVTAEQLNLGPLQDNGGPTETHALGAGSVAIDQIPADDCVDADGAPLTTDQRGEPRPETGGTMCDVGAFEVQP